MKNIKKIVSAVMAFTTVMTFTGCSLVAKTPQAIQKSPVAKVGDEYITRQQLDSYPGYIQNLAQLKAQNADIEKTDEGKTQIKELKTQVLDSMITNLVIMQQAKKLNIDANSKEITDQVNKQFDEIKKSFNDDKKFADALKQAGYTEQGLKDAIREKAVSDKVEEEVTKSVKITDDKAKEYYEMNKLNYTTKPDMIKLAHILVKTKEEADKVETRLKNGEDFAKLAKELSTDTGSKDNGGVYEVPYVNSGMDETFMKAALGQKEGQISKPVQTQYGYHVIKTIKKTEYPYKPYESVKAEIITTLTSQEKESTFNKKVAEWKKATTIETKKYEKNLML